MLQSKLLTVIEQQKINRLGSTKETSINVRLICATNTDLHAAVQDGSFRQDLLYRINTIEIFIPPLRERGNDISLLADHFLKRYSHKYKKEIEGFSREARQLLKQYNWPGNVRELQHVIERAVILSDQKSCSTTTSCSVPRFELPRKGRKVQFGRAGKENHTGGFASLLRKPDTGCRSLRYYAYIFYIGDWKNTAYEKILEKSYRADPF